MPKSKQPFGAYAPWISDPDEPMPPMSDEQLKKMAKAAAKLMETKKAANSVQKVR
jgi:hypothetical protein